MAVSMPQMLKKMQADPQLWKRKVTWCFGFGTMTS